MFIVSGGRGVGKTKTLLNKVKEENAIIVCDDVIAMRERAYGYGITGLNIMSYTEFNKLENVEEPVYIHSLHKWLESQNKNVKGYSVCNI